MESRIMQWETWLIDCFAADTLEDAPWWWVSLAGYVPIPNSLTTLSKLYSQATKQLKKTCMRIVYSGKGGEVSLKTIFWECQQRGQNFKALIFSSKKMHQKSGFIQIE